MASNPYVNKVDLANGTTLIDLSTDTATQADVAQGKYFHLPTGERVQGTASGGGGGTGGTITQDQDGYLVLSPDGGGGGGGGGTIPWWGCGDEELLHTTTYEVKLSDTNWSSLTPSTSSQALTVPATAYSSAGTNVTIDEYSCNISVAECGIVVVTDTFTDFKYTTAESSMSVGHILDLATSEIRCYGQNHVAHSERIELASNSNKSLSQTILTYRNNAGTYSQSTVNYGFYYSPGSFTPALTSSGSTITKFALKGGASIRSHATMMETSAWSNVDATNTKLKIRIRIYKVAYPGWTTGVINQVAYMVNNAAFPTD